MTLTVDDRISVQAGDFDVGTEIAALQASGDVGAVAAFVGCVRADGGVVALEIEHYPGMTEASIAAIVAEAGERWPLVGVRVIHRVGRLPVGARIVLVAVASAHRGAAFDACEFIMDYLKSRAPFWKKAFTGQGDYWIEARASDAAAAARWRSDQ
jgi:molybdopterin synthase catalytic subunit